jgi:soluble cytochrome b562
MKFRKQALSLLFAASIVAAPVMTLTSFTASVHAADEKKLDTPLQKHMEEIEKEMKNLRKTLKKSDDNATSLKSIDVIKKASHECLPLIPAMAKDIPEADRAKFSESYKKEMEAFIAEVDKLEAAVKAGKNDEAVEIHKNLKKLEDKGHEKYTK